MQYSILELYTRLYDSIQLYDDEQSSSDPPVPSVVGTVGGVTQATVEELLPFTNYSCSVTANTSVGEGPPSDVSTARTVESSECIIAHSMMR